MATIATKLRRIATAGTWLRIAAPALVILLGAAAMLSVVVLQQHADDGRKAELQLSALKLELATLQTAPFRAAASTGGSARIAAGLMGKGKQAIAVALAELRRGDPPAALADLRAPLRANYAALDAIYRIGVATNGYGPEADRLSGIANDSQDASARLVQEAGNVYGDRAARAELESRVGAAVAILLLLVAFAFLYRKNRSLLESSQREALFDALTGLRNRRALVADLADGIAHASAERPLMLGLFDLDGFKLYNDTFGHPAGDALLTRLSMRLAASLEGAARPYRMGGDEFCLLAAAPPGTGDELMRRASAALSEVGETFRISCSSGSASIPAEAASAEAVLQLADQRLYAKKLGTASASRQSSDVLLQVLSERGDSLDLHVSSVGRLARQLAAQLGLPAPEQDRVQMAAQLHDIGKTAIPDSLLHKPGDLTADEWSFMRQHTLIGERILLAAPSLAPTAALVRSSHERTDGKGYPDGLAGDAIPLGSRIIAVCDAFDAMTADRSYRRAMSASAAFSELLRNAGTQFDPAVVEAFAVLAADLVFDQPGQAA